jgi:hypothetical protein
VGRGYLKALDPIDHDFNLLVIPDRADGVPLPRVTAGAKTAAGSRTIELEFDGRETVALIPVGSGDYGDWERLLTPQSARRRVSHDERYAAVGLFGLDAGHKYHPELHPVRGLAVETVAGPDATTWMVFVRPSGNEGGCSSRRQHLYPRDRLALVLPAPHGATSGEVEHTSFPNAPGAAVEVQVTVRGGIDPVVHLNAPVRQDCCDAREGFVFGELRVLWKS